ncbi:AAA family ATPase [Plesiomonas shigelloides]|uniref:ATP-dependent nuclease n=1 Tax=Plesiomonas shigelloides TaxID=703 RepID=UPI0012615908|nr:ATP-binding protein [Plesiomonas shigelloides]KAB7681122.1 AAA family ATPase [Plesiomonas shigelloides]
MHLSEIYIDNFKTYQKVRIKLDSALNVFTGTNNSGKTTILEALALWSECFRKLIVKAKKSDAALGIRIGDYRLGSKNQNYIDYRSITSVRTSKYEDIFYDLNPKNSILISVKLTGLPGQDLSIPIKIKSANGGNYLIFLDDHDNFNFRQFNSDIGNLPTPLTTIYASPVAALASEENFVLGPHVNHLIYSRRSFLVLRNRISRLKNSALFEFFERDISYILFENENTLSFQVIGEIHTDLKVDVNVSFGTHSTPKDISLLGSGTIQIVELMLAIYEEKSSLNLVLLDEPDSHIHRDIQKRLTKVLLRSSSRSQIFLTTHNESLIRATEPKHIFHICHSGDGINELQIKSIANAIPDTSRLGIQPSLKSKVIRALGNKDSLDILDCIEARKIIFVEGEDDAIYIREIYEKVTANQLNDVVFWALNGLDTFIKEIQHIKSLFNAIAARHNLWNKAIAIIDADFMTSEQKLALTQALQQRIQLRTHIWDEYTIEGSIISNLDTYKQLIFRIIASSGLQVEQIAINESVDRHYAALLAELQNKLNQEANFQMKISNQIVTRATGWHSSVNINNVFRGGEQHYLTNYQIYSRQELTNNKISHMTTKDDISKLSRDILNDFDYDLTTISQSLFSTLIDHYDRSLQIESWNQVVAHIDE